MKVFEVLVSYCTPDGYNEEHWVTVEADNEEDAKQEAIDELVSTIRMYADAEEVKLVEEEDEETA